MHACMQSVQWSGVPRTNLGQVGVDELEDQVEVLLLRQYGPGPLEHVVRAGGHSLRHDHVQQLHHLQHR